MASASCVGAWAAPPPVLHPLERAFMPMSIRHRGQPGLSDMANLQLRFHFSTPY